MTKRAQRLRQNTTDAEQKLWRALRRNQIGELSFRRQHPIGAYVIDFYCPALRLAIEVDGGQHGGDAGHAYDDRRSRWLGSKGITVLRYWNNDVLSNLEGVLENIVHAIETLKSRRATPSRRASRADLPLSGGGEGTGAT
jgi:very-short-patch-repair endonuclease